MPPDPPIPVVVTVGMPVVVIVVTPWEPPIPDEVTVVIPLDVVASPVVVPVEVLPGTKVLSSAEQLRPAAIKHGSATDVARNIRFIRSSTEKIWGWPVASCA